MQAAIAPLFLWMELRAFFVAGKDPFPSAGKRYPFYIPVIWLCTQGTILQKMCIKVIFFCRNPLAETGEIIQEKIQNIPIDFPKFYDRIRFGLPAGSLCFRVGRRKMPAPRDLETGNRTFINLN